MTLDRCTAQIYVWLRWLAAWALIGLSACGGGGGGDAGGSSSTAVPTGPTITISGQITYERVASNSNGSLNYFNISRLPARGVTVQLYANSIFIAETSADANGVYTFTQPVGNTSLVVRAFSELKKTTGSGKWNVGVADNTRDGAVYSLISNAVGVATSSATINLHASSGWSATTLSYTTARQAAPFAIADTFYTNMQKVLTVAPDTVFPPLSVFWSVNNTTASGDVALGQIGVSYFQPSGALGGPATSRFMFLLGAENSDTDEYDESVISHEWGHYYQSAFSRDDSPGGAHGGTDDRLDRRLSFSEGWGTAWSGIALNNNSYKDSYGNKQGLGFTISLTSGHTSTPLKGWFRERSISYILWTLSQQVGFGPIHAAMTNPAFTLGVATPDIYSFAAAFRSLNAGVATNALNALLSAESINTTSDAFGNNETANGGSTVALPFYKNIGQSLCASNQFDPRNAQNKIGRFVYVRFTTPNSGIRTITVSSTSDVDPEFEVFSGGFRKAYAIDFGPVQIGSVSLGAGEHLLVIWDDANNAAPCFTVTVQ